MPPVIFLMGPTASGKTQLAVELVQKFPLEIISVDSAMVYRGMDIGTAKPAAATLARAPHHLIDIRDPAAAYSAAQFCDDALRLVNEITARQKIPLLVGGTMLYFRALLKGLSDLPSASQAVRADLLAHAAAAGWPALHAELTRVDAVAASRIHPHDGQRIQRALEVYKVTGVPLSEQQASRQSGLAQYTIYSLALAPDDRSVLHARIAARFMQMLSEGLLEEVRCLYARGDLSLETPAMRAAGYRQVWEHLSGQLSYKEMEQRGIIATRQLAKRQLTWLRHWPDIHWFDSEMPGLTEKVAAFVETLVQSKS